MGLFNRPSPQQAVPGDLGSLRGNVLQAILSGQSPSGDANGLLSHLVGLGTTNPGQNVLGPLSASFNQRLTDQLSQANSSGGRFSTGNAYSTDMLRERSLNDYNTLAAQVLQQGQGQQLQAIMGLLGPALGPTFGGPFTQGASPFENILGGVDSIANLIGAFKGGKGTGGGSGHVGGSGLGFPGAAYGGSTGGDGNGGYG